MAPSTSSQWRHLLLSFCAVLSLSIPSLKAADPDYLMMAPGAEWTFDLTTTLPDGTIDKGSAMSKIGEKVNRGEREYFRETTTVNSAHPFEITRFIRVDETGYYAISKESTGSDEQKEIALPLKVGATWDIRIGEKVVKTTVSSLESVTVNEKTYEHCFHVVGTLDQTSFDYWLAPNVGRVKMVVMLNPQQTMTLTLREFKPGKPAAQ